MAKSAQKEQISFNVSARTARLIGRENVATAEGAVIELVKNTYDADAGLCIVFFHIVYDKIPKTLTVPEFEMLNQHQYKIADINLDEFYSYENGVWNRKSLNIPASATDLESDSIRKAYVKESNNLMHFFSSFSDIYIIDNGEGMDSSTIKEKWMTIGTDNKFLNHETEKGRIKSGAKGIGRFALDKLGRIGKMMTITQNSHVIWNVDWESFEQQGKNIDQIFATIEYSEFSNVDQIKELLSIEALKEIESSIGNGREFSRPIKECLQTGTILKISALREVWNRNNLESLRAGLESVVPPREDPSFELFLYNNLYEELNGRLLPETCDDFDYKLEIVADDNLNLDIKIYRNEFNIEAMPDKLFERAFFKKDGYLKSDFEKGVIGKKISIGALMPGISDSEDFDASEIGIFAFSFYFLKQTSGASDRERYYLKEIPSKERRDWLENNSGVKVFRDNFRVRPYGEKGSSSWDWLELGDRVAKNPAAVSRKGWSVSPANLSGVISISRVNNPNFQDKSSREGLQESSAFLKFRQIIIRLIQIFEEDRSSIYNEIKAFRAANEEKPTAEDVNEKVKIQADQYAKQRYEEYKEKKSVEHKVKPSEEESLALAYLNEKNEKAELERDLEDAQKENFLLRIFASSGVTIASFTHELSNLQMKLGDRFQDIKTLISKHISEKSFEGVHRFENPFYVLEKNEEEDKKIKRWLQYTLRTIRKDKRKRKQISIVSYFESFEADWIDTIHERKASFSVVNNLGDYSLRAYEIDLDCIFNNLIINSLDAFLLKKPGIQREIIIALGNAPEGLEIIYSDKGPGLSKDLENPNDIFEATVTTKRDKNGKEIGTGMGMWLLKKTLDEYNAVPTLLTDRKGFGLRIIFPRKYERK